MKRAVWWCLALLVLAPAASALAQSSPPAAAAEGYVLGPDDVVAISVWLHPELERTAKLRADGNITFPPIGEIQAAGLTPRALADRIADRLSTYLRQTATVTVIVTDYAGNSVVVTGAVAAPGRYGFERMPPLLDVIDRAGGAQPGADLSRVQILRKEGASRRILNADIAAALQAGIGETLPALRPGDTIVVPAAAGGNLPPGTGVSVLGEVARPGVYGVGDGQDLWSVLAASGGLAAQGDLAKVRILRQNSDAQTVATINLKDVLHSGGGAPYVVYSGDVIFVERTGQSFFGRAGRGFTALLNVSRDVLNVIVLVVLLDQNSSNTN
jgi:polysaccharide export outer membrane protein